MQALRFQVQGSAPEPSTVTFLRRDGRNLSAYCTRPAGASGQYCAHRPTIMAGEVKGIVSDNEPAVAVLQVWVRGSGVEVGLHELAEAEQQFERPKRALTAAKKLWWPRCTQRGAGDAGWDEA